MREDFSAMTMSKLVDLLAQETEKFTHLLTYKKYGSEYDESKKKIHRITAAINDHRNKSQYGENRNNSDPNS